LPVGLASQAIAVTASRSSALGASTHSGGAAVAPGSGPPLPQAPEARRPDRDPLAPQRARNRVLDRALAAGVIDAEAADAAPSPLLAPT
jgi:hypothetical protein